MSATMEATRQTGLTHDDVQILNAPFAVDEHEFLRGFTYIREDAIAARLDQVDPAWTFEILQTLERNGTISVIGRLTVKGTSRDNIGMETVKTSKSGNEANEAEKSAATDAFKRAARHHGVGRYLLKLKGVGNERDLARALKAFNTPPAPATQQRAQAPAGAAKTPQNGAQRDTGGIVRLWMPTDAEIQTINESAQTRFNMGEPQVLAALQAIAPDVKFGFSDWPYTKEAAIAAIIAQAHQHDIFTASAYIDQNPDLAPIKSKVIEACKRAITKPVDRDNAQWNLDSIYPKVQAQLDQQDKFAHVNNWTNWLDKHYPDDEQGVVGSDSMHNPRTEVLEMTYSDALEMLVSKRKATQAFKRGEQSSETSTYEMKQIPFA